MKRGGPLKRSPMRRGAKRSRYATRDRDTAYMMWVKGLRCVAAELGPCSGVIEADHAGRRGLGRKCADDETIPICTGHHRQRTDFSGDFKTWDRAQMREWLAGRVEETQSAAQLHFQRG